MWGAIAMLAFVWPSQDAHAQGTTYYVATSGNDSNPGTTALPWRTVLKAAQTLTAGQTALVRGGTYAERSIMFTHSGAPGNPITIKAATGEVPVIDAGFTTSIPPDGVGDTPVFNIDGTSYITLDGLTIKRGRTANVTISNDRVTTDITIQNCTLLDFTTGDNAASIYVNTGSHRITIKDNSIHGRIAGLRANVANGIIMFNAGDVTIQNNNIYDLVQGISYKHSVDRRDQVFVENNLIHDITDFGILWSKKEAIIRNNVLYRTGLTAGYAAILVFQEAAPCASLVSSGNQILHNTIVEVSNGINLERSTACPGAVGTIVRDNLISNYRNTEYVGLAVWPYRGPDQSRTIFDHNLVSSSLTGGKHAMVGTSYYSLNSLPTTIVSSHNVSNAPVFANLGARDYTLMPGPGKLAASDGTDLGARTCSVGVAASCGAPARPTNLRVVIAP
jgi:hypothetical protein